MNLKFAYEKETPGAVQYKEVDETGQRKPIFNATIGTLYVRKSAIKGLIPREINLEVELG